MCGNLEVFHAIYQLEWEKKISALSVNPLIQKMVTKEERRDFLLIAFLVTMLLFLPIMVDVVADSVSNMVTLKISETKN